MKTKKELQEHVKNILNTSAMWLPLEGKDLELLKKLYHNYYIISTARGKWDWDYDWNNIDDIKEIHIGYNKGESWTTKGFQLIFPGKIKKQLKGKISGAHGNKGVMRAIFERGLPGQALTTGVEIKSLVTSL